MTARETKLWIIVGTVVAGALLFNLLYPHFTQTLNQPAVTVSREEAVRILRAEDNIRARNQAVVSRYQQLCRRFYLLKKPAEAELNILKVVEELAYSNEVPIKLKNTVRLPTAEIGVALEGTAGSKSFFRFLQQLTQAPVCFKIKRMQLHSIPEKRVLEYQLVLSVLMVE